MEHFKNAKSIAEEINRVKELLGISDLDTILTVFIKRISVLEEKIEILADTVIDIPCIKEKYDEYKNREETEEDEENPKHSKESLH